MDRYRDFVKEATEYDCEEKLDMLIEVFEAANLSCYEEFIEILKRFRTRMLYCFNSNVFYSLTRSIFPKQRAGKKRGTYNKQNRSKALNLPEEDDE